MNSTNSMWRTLIAAGIGLLACIADAQPLANFVLIPGGTLARGEKAEGKTRREARLGDFEMLDHPVTNREWRQFTDATNHPKPLHWAAGEIPVGKEDEPVIFINRADVRAFLQWLARDGRTYRLPTIAEFEYAASGGLDAKYPWGDDLAPGRANYDVEGTRPFTAWKQYLQPARSFSPNKFGLHGMAGNVWQMVIANEEPGTMAFRYRIEDLDVLETGAMGGSWARSATYLRRGAVEKMQGGMRQPDLGFRPVRAPLGADWNVSIRHITALPQGDGIFLSWASLSADASADGFHVYRSERRDELGVRVTANPVKDRTTFVDASVRQGTRYHYYVRSVAPDGTEGRRSEWAAATPQTADGFGVVSLFTPLAQRGGLTPVFGDLNGDGAMDCVIRMENGNNEASPDPGVPVQIEAFTSWGRSLWRRDISDHAHIFGNGQNAAFNVWDMDGDGKAEVITLLQQGEEMVVAILDGITGAVKHTTPWTKMVSDFQKSSTRMHLSVVCLDGKTPAVVTQSGLYENEILTAYDSQLRKLWQFNSFGETSGSGGHKIEAADVDGDGKQEVFDGTTCLNSDGTIRWSIHRQHADLVSIRDYLPERPGLEVCYIIETAIHAGIYMVDASTGAVLWKNNREDDSTWTHGHVGWTADIWDGSPGVECVTNRSGHQDKHLLLFSAAGRKLISPFPWGYRPVEWDGDTTRELYTDGGRFIGDFDGKLVVRKAGVSANRIEGASVVMVADLCGDFRDEFVLEVPAVGETGRSIAIVTATESIPYRYVSGLDEREYRFWLARNKGGGYGSVYDRGLTKK